MEEPCCRITPVGEVVVKGEEMGIQIAEDFREALIGLEGFSHISLLWWFHQVDTPEIRKLLVFSRPYIRGPEMMGAFATRSPARPNPLGFSVAAVTSVDRAAGWIGLAWVDAEAGTPVLDIKPYHPSEDRVRDVQVPEWCRHWPQWMEESEFFPWHEEFNFPE